MKNEEIITKLNGLLDRLFDRFDLAVRLARENGHDKLADDMELDFIPLHDRALKGLANAIENLRINNPALAQHHIGEMELAMKEITRVMEGHIDAAIGRRRDDA